MLRRLQHHARTLGFVWGPRKSEGQAGGPKRCFSKNARLQAKRGRPPPVPRSTHTRAYTSLPSITPQPHTGASERRMLSTLARRPVAAAAALRNGASSSQVGVGALRCLCVRRDGGSQGERDDVCVAWGAMGTSCASHTCVGSQWHRSRSTVSPQPPPPSHIRTHPPPPPPTQTRSHHITQIVPRAVLSTAQSKEPYSERQARTGACPCLRLCFGGGCPGGGCPGDDGRGKGGA